jgi:hypothetical protein
MSPPAPDIYEHDVDAASDEAFEAGTLGHLVKRYHEAEAVLIGAPANLVF